MVMHGIDFAIWMVNSQPIPGQGAVFYMENPVGSLCHPPYMKLWEETGMVTRHEVLRTRHQLTQKLQCGG